MPVTVYYASIGPRLFTLDLDVERAALQERSSIALPANIQYAWPHPSRRYLYAVSSNGGPGIAGDAHFASALAIDARTGALNPVGASARLRSRPIHTSVDRGGSYLLTAYNNPSSVSVHRLNADGTIGDEVAQPDDLDTGIYAHQVLAAPSNGTVVLVTRGNDARADKPEDPGALKIFSFRDGLLGNVASVAPGNGLGFGPRHLDFHPTQPWVFVSIERQNKLYVYRLDDRTGIAREPLFIADTLLERTHRVRQAAGPIHVHPNGRYVYLTNRTADTVEFAGRKVFAGGENSVAVFAIDQQSGEPTLLQNIDGDGIHLRTFGIDPGGSLLAAASIMPMPIRQGDRIGTMTAKRLLYRIGDDGRLDLARKYEIDTGAYQQFWSGLVTLA